MVILICQNYSNEKVDGNDDNAGKETADEEETKRKRIRRRRTRGWKRTNGTRKRRTRR